MSESEPPPPGSEGGWEPSWDPDTGPLPGAPQADPRSGPRSHRAKARSRLGRLLGPLMAVVVVVIVIGLLIWINGRPVHRSNAAAAGSSTSSSPLPSPHSSSAAPPSTPPTTPSTSPKSRPSKSATPPPPPTKTAHPTTADRNAMAPVQVLNNSRRTGLAHEVAADIAARGWKIGVIGNLRGLVSVPTVYYSPGEEPAAKHLQREFSSVQRIEPNSALGLTATGITLVLTEAWET